jgi:FtsH-binding integral membrane protein
LADKAVRCPAYNNRMFIEDGFYVWLGLAVLGFVLGLWVGAKVPLRLTLGLFVLSGLGLVLANMAQADALAYWLAAGTVAAALVFATAAIGAALRWLVRRRTGRDSRPNDTLQNTIL